jgi:hypothetical protein
VFEFSPHKIFRETLNMPIVLGEALSTPRWNGYVLFILWLLQFLFIGFLEFMNFVIGGWGRVSGNGKAEEQLYDFPFHRNRLRTVGKLIDCSLAATLIVTFILLLTIPYEAHVFATGHLSAQKFYRLQLVKSVYLGLFGFIVLCVEGWLAFGAMLILV